MVIELQVGSQELQERETCLRPVHELDPRFEFSRERLHFLVWANSYDARSGDPIWWHGRKAARSFADQGVTETGPADIQLPDGTALYVDGGPFAPPLCPGAPGWYTAGIPRRDRCQRWATWRRKPTWPRTSWRR